MLPKNLLYTSRIESAPAKSSRVGIAPQNGTGPYGLNDTVILNIPTRPNLVLVPSESYLKFTLPSLANGGTANNALRLDSSGAHGLIQSIKIFHGSNQLQSIDNYGLLTKMLFDISVPTDAILGKQNILAGTRGDLTCNIVQAAVTAGANGPVSCPVNNVNSGDLLRNAAAPTGGVLAANETTVANTYCINLVSLLGTLCSNNYFPLFMLSGAPLRLEIQLVDSLVKGMNCLLASPSTQIMTNVEYVANFIELSDSAMSMIMSSLNGSPLQFVFPDYRNYQYSAQLAATPTATQVQFPVAAKFSSLKSLFITIRDKGTGALTFFPGSSVTAGITDYQFRIGPNVVPPKPVNTFQEMFSECVKAIGSMSDNNYQPSIDKFAYTMAASVANTAALEAFGASNINSGSFYIGLDLENYCNADKSQIFAGANTNTDDIYCIMNFASPLAQPQTVRFDCFAMFDSVIVFENNTCYVRF